MQSFPQPAAHYSDYVQSDHDLQHVLDCIPGHVALIDQNSTIIAVNRNWKAFADANGYQGDDYGVGTHYLPNSSRKPGADGRYKQGATATIMSVLDGVQDSGSFIYPCHAPDRKRWFRMHVSAFAYGDAPHALVMHFDATAECEGRMAEIRELRRLRREGRDKRIDQTIHDIKNPLNVVSGIAQLMELGMFEPKQEKQRDFGQSIQSACDEMMRIIEDLVDTVAHEPGVSAEAIDIGALLGAKAQQYELAASKSRQRIRCSVTEKLPPLYAARQDIERMIANLIVNAIKYAGVGATISLRGYVADGRINLEVEDDGAGVSSDLVAAIQKSGVRGPSNGSTGNGIGLASVRDLAERNGGSFAVSSELGRGFHVRLAFSAGRSILLN